MNKHILHKDVQAFIDANLDSDVAAIAFQKNPFSEVSMQELLTQIESKKKAKSKLPTWFNTQNIYYPPKKNLEQTSSEVTAAYKATLLIGNNIADLTGGFGVDCFYFSKKAKSISYFETNEALCHTAAHNFVQLKATNIKCFAKDGVAALKEKSYDSIYVDPSRRHQTKGKVFLLEDCLPDIITHQGKISNHCNRLLIKTSPMLDIALGMERLHNVAEVHIVAVNNEVKELLWVVEKNTTECKIVTVNLKQNDNEVFSFDYKTVGQASYSESKTYLYEPNAALLKSGAFDLLSEEFLVQKLHQNTHLYTSEELIPFPGRRFRIEKVLPDQKRRIRNERFKKANITTRNFPESVVQLKKKWKIADGGAVYLFFTTDCSGKRIVIQCHKI